MPLFYLINGWAGRIEWLDTAMRLFVVGAVPLLWTCLVWALLMPRTDTLPARRAASWPPSERANLALAAALSALGCLLAWWAIVEMARQGWGTDIFSPRPFITHRVNVLLVEPNDNSYPCIEVAWTAIAATLLWAVRANWGRWAWSATLLFGLARVFCGANYPIDIVIGWLLGWAIAALCLATRRATLGRIGRDGQRRGGLRMQSVLSSGIIALILGAALLEVLGAPRAAMRAAQNNALPNATPVGEGTLSRPQSVQLELPATVETNTRYGRVPRSESDIGRALEKLHLPHRIVGVEVAQITVGTSPYRVAGVRFEVQPQRANERRLSTQSAARIVKTVFAADASIQNVDVLGVIFPVTDAGTEHLDGEGGTMTPATNEPRALPVFTASIQRRNLLLSDSPAWLNAPNADAGLWLRARSKLYLDPQVLAKTTIATPTPAPTPNATIPPQITPKPTPIVKTAPIVKPTATVKPTPIVKATPIVKPTAKPVVRVARRRAVRRFKRRITRRRRYRR